MLCVALAATLGPATTVLLVLALAVTLLVALAADRLVTVFAAALALLRRAALALASSAAISSAAPFASTIALSLVALTVVALLGGRSGRRGGRHRPGVADLWLADEAALGSFSRRLTFANPIWDLDVVLVVRLAGLVAPLTHRFAILAASRTSLALFSRWC